MNFHFPLEGFAKGAGVKLSPAGGRDVICNCKNQVEAKCHVQNSQIQRLVVFYLTVEISCH